MPLWLRLYAEILDDPKVQMLPTDVFRGWINLLCLAARHDGKLPNNASIAFALRIPEADSLNLIEALIKAGLIEAGSEGMRPYNWEKRQYKSDSSTERVKRFRNVSETPPDTDTDSEPEADRKPRERDAQTALGESADFILTGITKSQKREKAALWKRLKAIEHKEPWLEWWSEVLAGVWQHAYAYSEFLGALKHVEDAINRSAGEAKGIGEAKQPERLLVKKATAICKKHKIRWPQFPEVSA